MYLAIVSMKTDRPAAVLLKNTFHPLHPVRSKGLFDSPYQFSLLLQRMQRNLKVSVEEQQKLHQYPLHLLLKGRRMLSLLEAETKLSTMGWTSLTNLSAVH